MVFFLLILVILLLVKKYYAVSDDVLHDEQIKFFRIIALIGLFLSMLILFVLIYLYIFIVIKYKLNLHSFIIVYSKFFIFWTIFNNLGFFTIDFFSLIILFLGSIIGFISLLSLGNKFINNNTYLMLYFYLFLLVVAILTTTNNIIVWILMYECLLLPSFFIVYYASSSRRSIQASLYFIVFTQIGSFIVICVVSYIISVSSIYLFSDLSKFVFTNAEQFYLYLFLFIGFGIKIPIWPFHYWLTKTHVEASAGFSMYLSGFLVKVAALGFYKFSLAIGGCCDNSIFIVVCIMGIIDASLKLFSQTDIKKLVAYCTILEMNLIYLSIIWGDSIILFGGLFFVYTHGFLSSLMFFLVDCVQKRYSSRNVTAVCGVLHTTPNLAIAIFVMCVIFSGIPGTTKFTAELNIFLFLFNYSPFLTCVLMFIVNFLGIVGFSKIWFNLLFGMSNKFVNANIIDLSIYELIIITTCMLFLILGNFIIVIN